MEESINIYSPVSGHISYPNNIVVIDCNIECDSIIAGGLVAGGDLVVTGDIRSSSPISIGGNVKANNIIANGEISIGGDADVDNDIITDEKLVILGDINVGRHIHAYGKLVVGFDSKMIGKYMVTCRDDRIKIGCSEFKPDNWLNFRADKQESLDEGGSTWWRTNKDVVMSLYARTEKRRNK